jgi:hypothetical protein
MTTVTLVGTGEGTAAPEVTPEVAPVAPAKPAKTPRKKSEATPKPEAITTMTGFSFTIVDN